MDLYYIDHVSTSGAGWLHRVPPAVKLMAVVAVIASLLSTESLSAVGVVLVGVILLAMSAGLPLRLFLPLMFYPVVFLTVILLSIEGLTVPATAFLAGRVFDITGSVVIVLLTTSYPTIFATLGRVLPGFITAALFFTYRSLFIISDSITDLRIAMHLRGGFDIRHPVRTLRHFGMAMGHFVVHSIDAGQRIGDGLTVRGFANRVYFRTLDTGRLTARRRPRRGSAGDQR